MGKSIQKNKDKTSPVVSPARHNQQPIGLYSRYLQMKEDNTPLIQRRTASAYDIYVNPKMDVVDSEDASEKEADATADQVMSSSESDMDEEKIQTKPLAGSISRKGQSGGSGVAVSGNTASYVGGLSGGQPLNRQEKSFYEPRFGTDFSSVRVHNDPKAHEAAQSINAKAFTSGNNIVFGKGQYSPESRSGKHLIAHELTHVLQQKSGLQRTLIQAQQQQNTIVINNITYYQNRVDAEAAVDVHVSPSNCFVWNDGPNPQFPWRVIPGTGCAHWVAHEEGINDNPGCFAGNAIRVSQVTSGKTSHAITNAQVGDIWTNSGGTHTGIVRALNTDTQGNVTSVQVEHCSSGQGGVVTNNFTTGLVYR